MQLQHRKNHMWNIKKNTEIVVETSKNHSCNVTKSQLQHARGAPAESSSSSSNRASSMGTSTMAAIRSSSSAVARPSPAMDDARSSSSVAAWPSTTTKMLICPGWKTAVVPVSQPGTPVRDKRGCPFVPGLATAASAHVAGAPFCPGWCYQPGQKVSFFSCFSFLNSFSISIILLHFN